MYEPSGTTSPFWARPSQWSVMRPRGVGSLRTSVRTVSPFLSITSTVIRSPLRSRNEIVAVSVSQSQTGDSTLSIFGPRIGLSVSFSFSV